MTQENNERIYIDSNDMALLKMAISDSMKVNSQETELKVSLVNLEIKLSKKALQDAEDYRSIKESEEPKELEKVD